MAPMQISWRVKSQLRTLIIFAIIGVAAGIFILYPTNEFVYFYEYRPSQSTPVAFAASQLQQSLRGGTPKKTIFYGIVGLVLSMSAAGLYSGLHRRSERIEQLSAALAGDLRSLSLAAKAPTWSSSPRFGGTCARTKSTVRWKL